MFSSFLTSSLYAPTNYISMIEMWSILLVKLLTTRRWNVGEKWNRTRRDLGDQINNHIDIPEMHESRTRSREFYCYVRTSRCDDDGSEWISLCSRSRSGPFLNLVYRRCFHFFYWFIDGAYRGWRRRRRNIPSTCLVIFCFFSPISRLVSCTEKHKNL